MNDLIQALSDRAKIAACWCLACLLAVAFLQISGAADITPGYTFTPGEKNVTDVKLNAATSGTVATSFYTSRSAATAVNADTLLFYSASGSVFKKSTVQTFFNNVPQLNSLGTVNSVGDFTVNTSKFTVTAATGNTAVGGHLTVATNLTVTGTTTLTGALAGSSISTSGGIQSGTTLTVGTDITWLGKAVGSLGGSLYVSGNVTNAGDVYLGDAAGDTVTLTGTLAGTLQGTPTVSLTAKATPTTADSVLLQDAAAANVLKSATLSSLGTAMFATFTTNLSLSTTLLNVPHGLGGNPDSYHMFFVCTNAELGFNVGDEVLSHNMVNGSERQLGLVGANATNIFAGLGAITAGSLNIRSPTNLTFGVTAITPTNWHFGVRAVRKL